MGGLEQFSQWELRPAPRVEVIAAFCATGSMRVLSQGVATLIWGTSCALVCLAAAVCINVNLPWHMCIQFNYMELQFWLVRNG